MTVGIKIVIACVLLNDSVYGANILGVFVIPSYSHFTLGNRLMRELATRGHQVTYVSPFKDKDPPKGYRDVTLEGFADKVEAMTKDWNIFEFQFLPAFVTPIMFSVYSLEMIENVLSNANFQELLKSNATFDLIIIEQVFNEALRGLQHHYKAPVVISSSIGPSSLINQLTLNPSPSSYISNMYLAHTERHMDFLTRTRNFFLNILEELLLYGYQYPQNNELMHKYFPDAPHLYDILFDIPLILLNSHISTFRPVPITQNMVEIGGYHVYPPKKLPENLQKYLDTADEGVILFSMGSNLKSKDMAPEKRSMILKTFAKLKQKVLWKWEEDTMTGKPDNVKLEKWLPQQDILHHPNIKLFITHGGLLSTTEAIYHGVPIVGIPIVADQQMNMGLAEVGGYGKTVPYGDLTEALLSSTIYEVLSNSSYKKNAKRRQRLIHDRPMSPIDTAMWWIEYVLRNPQPDFHRSPGLDLKWYQLYLIDVITFLGFVCILFIATITFGFRKCCCSKKKYTMLDSKVKNN